MITGVCVSRCVTFCGENVFMVFEKYTRQEAHKIC